MDGVEVIDLCSESKTKKGEQCEGKESSKQESRDKMKMNPIVRKKGKNSPGEGKAMTENEENKTAMMCWKVLKDSLRKEPHEESEDEGEKPVEKMQKPKDGEEHVKPTLNIGNRLKNLIKEFNWETEDGRSTLDTQETEQPQLVYITNLEGGLQRDGMKLYKEEGRNDKKPAAKNRCFEEPVLNNLNHVYELYEESGSDNKNIEEIAKGEKKKNVKESRYTNIDEDKKGNQADLLEDEKPENHHKVPRKNKK